MTKQKIILVPSDKKKVYLQYLTFLNPFLNLTNNEAKVVAEILYYYKQSEGAKEHIRWDWVFSTETRKKIKEDLDMTDSTFNTVLNKLRSKSIITENSLNKNMIIDPDDDFEIVVKFKFNNETRVKENNRKSGEGGGDNSTSSMGDMEDTV
jgi:hypothetical protein